MSNRNLKPDELRKIPYVNLHLHTHFSILDGVGTVGDHIKRAHECGHKGFCVTDHSTMAATLEAYTKTHDKDWVKKNLGIEGTFPFVIGNELYITQGSAVTQSDIDKTLAEIAEDPSLDAHQKTAKSKEATEMLGWLPRDINDKYNHVTVMAKNNQGWKNLCTLTSIASSTTHFYSRPRISLEELIKYKEGLIITSGCFIGMIPQAIHKDTGREEELTKLLKREFGGDFYIEIHISNICKKWDKATKTHIDQGYNPQEKVNLKLLELAKKFEIKCYITQDAHMPKKEHHLIQNIMIWNSPSGKEGWHFHDAYYVMDVVDMYEKVAKNCPYIDDRAFVEYCVNSVEVMEKCKGVDLTFEPTLPAIKHDEHPAMAEPKLTKKLEMLQEFFKESDPGFAQVLEWAKKDKALALAMRVIIKNRKFDIFDPAYRDRITAEIRLLQRNGMIKLCDYFLLLEDVTVMINKAGYLRGFGRGSGPGSLLCYSLDITDCDPIKFKLSFDRFFNPERAGKMRFLSLKIPE